MEAFKPALIVVDVQEDFCPPDGSLAVPNGRDIIPTVNRLLSLPFVIKVATKDWHPPSHISFASNHPNSQPFVSYTTITNPLNPSESYESRLWPIHCVQGTRGAELIPELDISKIDKIIEKGQDDRVEMYSAFYDPLKNPRVSDSRLAELLRAKNVTDVFVVGLAADYCVQSTAVDAANEGFNTWIVKEGTRHVEEESWLSCQAFLGSKSVQVVSESNQAVKKVMALRS